MLVRRLFTSKYSLKKIWIQYSIARNKMWRIICCINLNSNLIYHLYCLTPINITTKTPLSTIYFNKRSSNRPTTLKNYKIPYKCMANVLPTHILSSQPVSIMYYFEEFVRGIRNSYFKRMILTKIVFELSTGTCLSLNNSFGKDISVMIHINL